MLRNRIAAALIFAAISFFASAPVAAQPAWMYCYTGSPGVWSPCSATNPLQVTASVSIAGFAPATTGTPISATTGGVTGTLPAGAVVVATNVGTTNGAYCKLGGSSTTSDQYIAPNGGWFAYTVGASTQLTCITGSSTTTVNMVGGSGIPTGTGGGGGGGGGGAVTLASGAVASGAYSSGAIASGAVASGAVASGAYASGAFASGAGSDGWDVAQGATGDAAASAGGTGTASAKLRLITTQLNTLNTNVTSPVPDCGATPCTNKVGNFYAQSQYPASATPISDSDTGTTGATVSSLPATSGKTNFVCGFSVRSNATGAATGNATLAGTITGTLNFTHWTAPLASGLGLTEMIFTPCLPASGSNTALTLTSPAPGSGGTVSTAIWGYQL